MSKWKVKASKKQVNAQIKGESNEEPNGRMNERHQEGTIIEHTKERT